MSTLRQGGGLEVEEDDEVEEENDEKRKKETDQTLLIFSTRLMDSVWIKQTNSDSLQLIPDFSKLNHIHQEYFFHRYFLLPNCSGFGEQERKPQNGISSENLWCCCSGNVFILFRWNSKQLHLVWQGFKTHTTWPLHPYVPLPLVPLSLSSLTLPFIGRSVSPPLSLPSHRLSVPPSVAPSFLSCLLPSALPSVSNPPSFLPSSSPLSLPSSVPPSRWNFLPPVSRSALLYEVPYIMDLAIKIHNLWIHNLWNP